MTSSFLFAATLAPILTGVATMRLPRRAIAARTLLAATGPAISFVCVLWHIVQVGVSNVSEPAAATDIIPWAPLVNLNLSFLADGLGVFFALLVSGIGVLIVLYARGYFGRDQDDLYRFYPTLGFFTTAMMGIVLSDYTLQTLLFWELTSISSFLLIGWDREDKESVRLAMQAFFTTGLGGMFLLGGILLLGMETGAWRWSELLRAEIDFTPGVNWAFVMMLLGAATKSAQWPWHYWLPGAMAAPTPVSAFLHSATMVKAGVYLTGRMYPILGEIDIWPWLILIPGAITMLLGAVIALNQHDLKKVFAYTTVSQLGLLICAYGLGHFESHGAPLIDLDISQIANHAFYKAPLFIIAGALGHALGTRELPSLFGAWKRERAIVATMLLAGYALAAGPGTVSFPAKEAFLYAIYHAFEISPWFQVLAVMAGLTAALNVAIFVRLLTTLMGWRFGLGALTEIEPEEEHAGAHHHHQRERGFWGAMIWLPGLIIVLPQYIGGLFPPAWNALFLPLETNVNYEAFAHGLPALWEIHFGAPLVMSLIAFAGGAALGLSPIFRGTLKDVHDRVYPAMYWLAVSGGGQAFRFIQNGNFRDYLMMALGALLLGFGAAVYLDPEMLRIETGELLEYWPGALIALIVCATAIMLPIVQQWVVRVLILGACGFSVVGMYLIYQAPDLALTQLMFELISVILFVLVLRLLPDSIAARPPRRRAQRMLIGLAVGIAFGWMTLIGATSNGVREYSLGEFFARHSYEGGALTDGRGGGGENIVNVILVDFRGFDTIGEISVLAIAALGVWSLLPRFMRRDPKLRDAIRPGRAEGGPVA